MEGILIRRIIKNAYNIYYMRFLWINLPLPLIMLLTKHP